MHEYSVARALLNSVEQQAARHGARVVRRVGLRIGELAGIEVGLLRSAFELVRERSICAEAELDIETVAPEWRCPACRCELSASAPLRCPDCGGPARLDAGDEILLTTLDLEVEDV